MENTLQRTPEEILARIHATTDEADPYGWQRQPLMIALPYDDATPFLKGDVAEAEWEQNIDPKQAIADHLPIAWHESVGDNRMGYDCVMARLESWAWLYNNDLYAQVAQLDNNKDKLKCLSVHFNYDHKAFMEAEANKGKLN